jgi:DNA-binding GntR family transcriptional regulator
MKTFLLLLAGACAGCWAAPQPPARPAADLRESLQQVRPGGARPAPRQLTPAELAQLRRQLADFGSAHQR